MLNTKQARKFIRNFGEVKGVCIRADSWTNKCSDDSKRNLGFEMLYGTRFTKEDCTYIRWMTGCKRVRITTSTRGYNYIRLQHVAYAN